MTKSWSIEKAHSLACYCSPSELMGGEHFATKGGCCILVIVETSSPSSLYSALSVRKHYISVNIYLLQQVYEQEWRWCRSTAILLAEARGPTFELFVSAVDMRSFLVIPIFSLKKPILSMCEWEKMMSCVAEFYLVGFHQRHCLYILYSVR